MRVAVVGGRAVRHGARTASDATGYEVVIGSRDAERAGCRRDRGRGRHERRRRPRSDLVVLATKAAPCSTLHGPAGRSGRRRPLGRLGLRFTPEGVFPCTDATSLAERVRRSSTAGRRGPPSLAASSLGGDEAAGRGRVRLRRRRDAKALALELAEQVTVGRAIDAGPLASARALEGLTAVVSVNKRYTRARGPQGHGPRVTGKSGSPAPRDPRDRGGGRPRCAPRRGRGRAGGLVGHDVLVVAQKVVSKAEGRVVRVDDVEPSSEA